MTPLVFIFGVGIFLVVGILFVVVLNQTTPQSAMLEEVTRRSGVVDQPEESSMDALVAIIARPFTVLRGIITPKADPDVAARLARAGYRKPEHADLFSGARIAVPFVAAVLTSFYFRENFLFFMLLAIVIGFFAPDFWLAEAIKRRTARIGASLPDGLDLISICLEAGLGLDQAIVRVAQEMRRTNPDLSAEFMQINFEQRAGVPRIESWRAFSDRIQLDSLRSFVAMLVQTERFGTPIAVALASFSDTLRTERRQKAEETGAKAAVKMVFPMVFFIFPMIFIVTVGPAIIGLTKNLVKVLE
jgi:tight adherence protein C